MQDLLGEIHERFKAWVRERRGARLSADPAVFDGSYCLGARGVTLGLIDGLGSVDELVRTLGGERARARRYRPRRRFGLGRLPRLLVETVAEVVEERGMRVG